MSWQAATALIGGGLGLGLTLYCVWARRRLADIGSAAWLERRRPLFEREAARARARAKALPTMPGFAEDAVVWGADDED